jgi:hypothetical protein
MKHLIIILLAFSIQLSAQDAGPHRTAPSSLSAKETAAYEAKAESKVAEFYSYLELLTDPKGTAEIKDQATESANKLFITNTLTNNIFEPKAASVSVAVLLESAKGQKAKNPCTVESLSIEPVSETTRKKEWYITYTLKKNNTTLNISQLFYIIQEDKKFGTTTKKVTNTYLGAITIK